MNKLIIKYPSYPKSRKIVAFEQNICICYYPTNYIFFQKYYYVIIMSEMNWGGGGGWAEK